MVGWLVDGCLFVVVGWWVFVDGTYKNNDGNWKKESKESWNGVYGNICTEIVGELSEWCNSACSWICQTHLAYPGSLYMTMYLQSHHPQAAWLACWWKKHIAKYNSLKTEKSAPKQAVIKYIMFLHSEWNFHYLSASSKTSWFGFDGIQGKGLYTPPSNEDNKASGKNQPWIKMLFPMKKWRFSV